MGSKARCAQERWLVVKKLDSADVLSTQSTRDPDVVNGMRESMKNLSRAAPRQPIFMKVREEEEEGEEKKRKNGRSVAG